MGRLGSTLFINCSTRTLTFGWLSIVPRVGFRATYYDETRDLGKTLFANSDNPLVPGFILPDPTPTNPIVDSGDGVRTVFDTGAEASFKVSRSWEDVQSRALGLDGLLHVIQPFTDFSYVHENGINPAAVLEFDRFEPSTQLRPIDFPDFTSIDSIASWTVWRLGVRNRLETRRDDLTVTWLELDTFADVNFNNPYDRRPYSNLFNKLRFTPLPWASLSIDSQIPAFNKGFTEVDTTVVRAADRQSTSERWRIVTSMVIRSSRTAASSSLADFIDSTTTGALGFKSNTKAQPAFSRSSATPSTAI